MPTGAAGAAASAVRSAVTTASSTAASVTATRPVVMTAAAATVTTSDNIGGAVINSDAAPAYRRPHSAATAQPLDRPLTLETWKAPFEALQRLIDRTHRDGAAARRGATEHSPSAAGHGGLAGRGSGASRNHQLTYLEKRELAQREQERANRLRRDPMAMMDQLFARARRKWIDLCVTMRVPEDERVLIEGQVERRDEPLTMRNALQTLHSEIERLTNLFNWTATLRRAVDAREAKLAALCEHVSALAAPAHPLAEDTSDGCGGDAGAASRLRADVRRGRSMAAARAEVCRTTLELVLAVRHASADVFSAHRRWQLAHGSTAPLPMFMYRGAAYLSP